MNPIINQPKSFWGNAQDSIQEWTDKLAKQSVIRRLWEKDASLWTKNEEGQKEVKARLGWLVLPERMRELTADMVSFAKEIKGEGFTHVLLLGMGGSSLAPEMFQSVFGNTSGSPELVVLDSTDPGRVKDIEGKVNLEKTLFIVSSKSGGTVELLSFFKYFYEKIKSTQADRAGAQFVAITDPGSPLADLAKSHHFRKIFLAPPDVGGRFSALTFFGLLPAALIGVDVKKVLESAQRIKDFCSADIPAGQHAAATLGIAMAVLAESGRDKLTILTTPGYESFGDWAEQLVAESTGKEDLGVVPIVREGIGSLESYGNDRFFVALLSNQEPEKNAALEKFLSQAEKEGHPVLTFRIESAAGLGGELFRWEMATAIASALLKINAFDQPDVQSAKTSTKAILKTVEAGGSIAVKNSNMELDAFWENAEEGDYVAILAFLPDREPLRNELVKLQTELRNKTRLAVTLGFGPRYLHSTGQLHKGGPGKAVFILLTAETTEDLPIPGEKYGFSQLELAQAMGDFQALESKGRWVYHARLKEVSEAELQRVSAEILKSSQLIKSEA